MKRCFFTILYTSIFCLVHAQTSVEVAFIKGNYQDVLVTTSVLSTVDDYYWHAQAQSKLGNIPQAIITLEKGLHDSSYAPQLEPYLAQLYYQSGMYHKAQPLLSKHQNRPELFSMLLSVLEFSNRYNEALALTKIKLATDSLNGETWKRLGNQYYAIQQFDSAQYALGRALQLYPQDMATAYLQVNVLLKTKLYAEAISLCNQMLDIDSINIKFINAKGISLFKNKSYLKAGLCFEKSYQLGDTSRFVLRHLGISKVISGMYYDGIEHLSKVLEDDSADVEANFFMGKAYAFTDTCEKGLYYLNIADSLLRPNAASLASIFLEKHNIYSSLGNHQLAIKCLEETYKLTPSPEYLYHIANYYQYEIKNSTKALQNYERFLEAINVKMTEKVANSDSAMVITPQGGTINMRHSAETNIRALREELFFQNSLK